MQKRSGWTELNFTEEEHGGHAGWREWGRWRARGHHGDARAGELRLWGGLCWVGWVSQVLGASPPPGDPKQV